MSISLRDRSWVLPVALGVVALGVGGIAFASLAYVHFAAERSRLVVVAQNQALSIVGLATLDDEGGAESTLDTFEEALPEIEAALAGFRMFGETGEMLVGRRDGDQIVFLIDRGGGEVGLPPPVPVSTGYADPMLRALLGESGVSTGMDYRGVKVLAAFEPVASLGLGVVAKIDMAEILAPFIRTGIAMTVLALTLVGAGVVGVRRLGEPLRRRVRESEARLRVLFEQAADALFLITRDGAFVDINERACQSLDYSRAELLTMYVSDIDPCFPGKTLTTLFTKLVQSGEDATFEAAHERRNGEVFPVEISSNIIELHGEPHLLSMVRDITGRKQMEESEQKLRDRIQQAQKLESLSVMAGGIAHDFNNLLMVMLGYADLVLADISPSGESYAKVQAIKTAGLRAAELSGQMLDYSGQGRSDSAPAHMPEIVRSVLQVLKVSLLKNVEVRCALDDRGATIDADVGQLRQVIISLVTNAVEATNSHDDGPKIDIKIGVRYCDSSYLAGCYPGHKCAEGDHVFVEIADAGRGMDHDTMGRMFDPFFSTKFTGRGLGLAATLGIVHGHAGAIRVTSRPEVGTTVTALFPIIDSPEASPGTMPASLRDPATGSMILLIDDEALVREVIRNTLTRAGYDVIVASSGEEAVQVLRGAPDAVDCVVMDLTMPGMDGVATFDELQLMGGGIPVILCSGYHVGHLEDRVAGRAFAGFLQKPYQLKELCATIDAAISRDEVEGLSADGERL